MKKILIIDDAATIRMYHRQILEEAGFAVDEAINGIEALEKCLMHHYDLYVVDVNMPKMDGCTFLRELRSRPEISQSPAVMVSTEAKQNDQIAAFEAGANYYVIKPADPLSFLRVVSLMLGRVGA
jgi:two-component system chemotaxis response regulator CheY